MAKPDRIDRNKPAARIAEKFGGLVKLSEALGKNPSTVHRWLVGGLIPSKHQAAVLDAARRAKVKVRAEDFIPEPEPAPVAA